MSGVNQIKKSLNRASTMKIYTETSLQNFEFWGNARINVNEYLSEEQIDTLENILEDLYPDGIEETDLNDLFAYEFETICEWLGIDSDEEESDEEESDEEDPDE